MRKRLVSIAMGLGLGLGLAVSAAAAPAAGPTAQFTVGGEVLRPGVYDLAALKRLPSVDVVAGAHLYTGVDLWDFLDTTVGLALRPGVKNDVLGMALVATGSDGYRAVLSLGELSDAFGGQPDLIAYAVDGVDLADAGFARIVVPGDLKAGRWVSNLAGIEVMHLPSPVPEPAVWAMWGIGLLAGCVFARRMAPSVAAPPHAGGAGH